MNKKKLLILGVILILISLIVGVVVWKTKESEPHHYSNNVDVVQNTTIKGRLQDYINNLTENYYIKYYGMFKNNSGELVNAVIEYTTDGENYAFRSTELNMHLLGDKEKVYSISHRYKLILSMDKKSIDTREYNLVSNIGQVFSKSYNENRNNTEYYVEEYIFNGNTLKYYFKESDIKLIKYGNEEIQIIRLEKQTNSEMLKKPDSYKKEQF